VSWLDRRPASGGAPAGFRKDRYNAKVLGVCGGLANYMNVDPMIVRVVFVAGTIFGFGSFVLIYLAIALLTD
jgi:phage shock protein PspC (stress-responsive transcriptional regulator)